MYNWSVDEKKFKNIREIIDFLKNQPDVISVKKINKKDRFGNIIIKTKLRPFIHPARKFFLSHHLLEKSERLPISIEQEKD